MSWRARSSNVDSIQSGFRNTHTFPRAAEPRGPAAATCLVSIGTLTILLSLLLPPRRLQLDSVWGLVSALGLSVIRSLPPKRLRLWTSFRTGESSLASAADGTPKRWRITEPITSGVGVCSGRER